MHTDSFPAYRQNVIKKNSHKLRMQRRFPDCEEVSSNTHLILQRKGQEAKNQ